MMDYWIIARRHSPPRWERILGEYFSVQEAQEERDAWCKCHPEAWTWAGLGYIAHWALATGCDPDDFPKSDSMEDDPGQDAWQDGAGQDRSL